MELVFTKREAQILSLSFRGGNCKHIAKILNISIHTVHKHRVNILNKLDGKNFIQAISYFHKSNEIPPERTLSILTKRESEISLLLAEGKTCKEIARKISISPSTVAKHREHIYNKLEIHSVLELSSIMFTFNDLLFFIN